MLTGDFDKLKHIETILKSLNLQVFSEVLAEATIRDIEVGFEAEEAPSGKKWAPLQHKRAGKILTKTGRMRGNFRLESVSKAGFKITNNVPYSPVHQYGSRKVPARPMLPDGFSGRYKKTVETALNSFLKRIFQ